MHSPRITIIGAGLSGLYAAYLLEHYGITDYMVLEARDGLGGRIASINNEGRAIGHGTESVFTLNRFDLGPTWFWPDYQRELDQLVSSLGLERFSQFEMGDMVVERSPDAPAIRTRGYVNAPSSMRLVGGMGALIEALCRPVNPARVITGQAVRMLRKHDSYVEIESEDAANHITTWHTEHVLLALPPRLLANSIAFDPAPGRWHWLLLAPKAAQAHPGQHP